MNYPKNFSVFITVLIVYGDAADQKHLHVAMSLMKAMTN